MDTPKDLIELPIPERRAFQLVALCSVLAFLIGTATIHEFFHGPPPWPDQGAHSMTPLISGVLLTALFGGAAIIVYYSRKNRYEIDSESIEYHSAFFGSRRGHWRNLERATLDGFWFDGEPRIRIQFYLQPEIFEAAMKMGVRHEDVVKVAGRVGIDAYGERTPMYKEDTISKESVLYLVGVAVVVGLVGTTLLYAISTIVPN